ncbi:MotA/TolQ/ExbB proton channel family protein [Pelagicoccus sp. SDUM812003]|uniref:MotA/TolQ/ExbB proton channel family protein n=1 Tax=Pelagicoccus sp. SDUM812003 TaxID=3041267 RepID=UPI00280D4258|nr:MotA/TolQ/ExbB proton channel family protein [Pelagicoccus sp. SDUM812003]MDQ8203467.1 MotA/TolQ/ExbB proton channel family protein [Pelagicoccus sp. SDUM812003]
MSHPTSVVLTLASLALLPIAHSQSANYEKLLADRDQRIEEALQDYQAFLSEIGDERLELVSEINRLENLLVKRRDERTKAQRSAETLQIDLERINQRISEMDTQLQYNSGVLSEYLNNFESRLHIAEDQRHREPLFKIRTELDSVDDLPENRIPIFFQAIDAGIERQEALLGGLPFEGRAITPTGGVKDGTILVLGPTAYFHSAGGSHTGFLEFNPGTIEPRLKPFPSDFNEEVSQLFSTGKGSLIVDASQGKANLLKEAKGSALQHLAKGGWVGYAILALGGLSLLVAILKMFDLRATTIDLTADPRSVAKSSIQDDSHVAEDSISDVKGPVRKVLSTGIEFAKAGPELALEAMETVIVQQRPRLQRFLPFLATTAAVAPLMGLLGTVVGMIKTFTLIEVFGTGDAKSLSSGISEALITTELGLIVAIPALVLHGVFSRMMRSRIAAMEDVADVFGRQLSKEKALSADDQRTRV